MLAPDFARLLYAGSSPGNASALLTSPGKESLPVEGVALIIGVDRFLDMVRTMVNVTGDATVATIVAHQEGQLDQEIYLDPNADHDGDLEEPQTTGAAA